MNMPSFTAEASVYRTRRSYRGAYGASRSTTSRVVPQQDVATCVNNCRQTYQGCVTRCNNPQPEPPGCMRGFGDCFEIPCCVGYHCCGDRCVRNNEECP